MVYFGVIDGDAALCHHLLKIAQAEIISQVRPHAEQDHGSIKMPALKHAETLKQTFATDPLGLTRHDVAGVRLGAMAGGCLSAHPG